MALKPAAWSIALACLVIGCRRDAPRASAENAGPEPLSVTRWTEKTELFAEYPPLVAGETSRFAIHLTTLDPFKAVTEGGVEVQLRGNEGDVETFRADGPSRPGIFGVDVKPARAGKRSLIIAWRSNTLSDEHRVGQVDVHPDAAAALAQATPAPGTEAIPFLKEQQWALEFGTAVVREQALRTSVRVPAEIVPRQGGEADVLAPFDGRLASVADVAIGASVGRGGELARVQPPPGAPADFPQLERARAEAAAALELATRDRERAERLATAGAVPQRRLDEARAAETQAAARLRAAQAQIAQFNAARTAGVSTDSGLFSIRAPIGGVIVAREAATGMNVTTGTRLFRIVDPSVVQVVGHVPESQASQARLAKTAQIEVPGGSAMVPAGRLVSVGQVLDPRSRTLPITFAADNRILGLAVGQAVFLHLLMERTATAPVIPTSAIVDDAGRPIVFVQVEGEAFERRAVSLGAREGGLVQVTSGVNVGEHVVTRGAYLVRLASLSTSVPAHGHVH